MPLTLTCINDQIQERYGFLWLKTRTVKNPYITKGESYRVYGFDFIYVGVYCLVDTDLGFRQWLSIDLFKSHRTSS